MINISQELGLVLFVGGIVGFFLFVIISGKKKKDTDTDKKNSSDKKWVIEGRRWIYGPVYNIILLSAGYSYADCCYCSINRLEEKKAGRAGE